MYIVITTSAIESVWQVSISSSGIYLCVLGEAASLGTAIKKPRSALPAFTPHTMNVSMSDTLSGAAVWNITDKLCLIKKKLHCPLDLLPDVSLSQILPNVSGPRHKRKPFWIIRCQPQVLIGPKSQTHWCCVLRVRRIFTRISSI